MVKTFKIDVSDFKDFDMLGAFEHYATSDIRKLNFRSDIEVIDKINNTLNLFDINRTPGWIFYKNKTVNNAVGCVCGVEKFVDFLNLDIKFLKTPYGYEFFKKENINFDILLSNKKKKLHASHIILAHDYKNYATLTSKYETVHVLDFFINDENFNTIKIDIKPRGNFFTNSDIPKNRNKYK